MMATGFELEFDGEELWHVETNDFTAKQRLNAGDWTLDRNLPSVAHFSIGSCFYNIPRCITGEKNPSESMDLSTVPPSTQLYTKSDVKLGVENTLICSVTGVHPPPVNISWMRNGEPVNEQDVSETQYYSNPDFSLRLFSHLNFCPKRGDIYTCSVRHRGLERDITRFWEVEVPEDSQEVEVVVLVIGILVGFLGFVLGIVIVVMSKLELRPE
ncbi:HLA class II histocompatibility antigen, DO alpha chain-like [Carassius auratus]|uniref:HLA class II histocompatibility antigen, DO alpha chain-like n=1 Tax=Carassius auratus TaxID=7957 RepID=A0A6P6LGC8_CARAU|nr:HLA class II histocompatibility antigen, DO alpha chain-like [Carassius auratus]XP_026083621.1 HLA class II histocompatibility antigen, DO alpha chain-like [Carassius auratus]